MDVTEKYVKKVFPRIVRSAKEVLIENFGKPRTISHKLHEQDVVTNADTEVSEILRETILVYFPGIKIICEETPLLEGETYDSVIENNEFVMVIDPIDGTRNYSVGIPQCGVMMALIWKKEPLASCVYDFIHDEVYYAYETKSGAWRGNQMIQCVDRSLVGSVGHTAFHFMGNRRLLCQALFNVAERFQNQGGFSATGLYNSALAGVYVADGRLHWYIDVGSAIWDWYPIVRIALSAGCVVTNFKGERWTYKDKEIIIAPPKIHQELLTYVVPEYKSLLWKHAKDPLFAVLSKLRDKYEGIQIEVDKPAGEDGCWWYYVGQYLVLQYQQGMGFGLSTAHDEISRSDLTHKPKEVFHEEATFLNRVCELLDSCF